MKKGFGYLLIFMVLMIPKITSGQSATLKASAKTNVEVGEQFRVVYEVNAEGSNFTGPDFRGFSLITGPMVSTSSSIQIVNGRMDRTFTQTYTYILSAGQEGEFTIEPANVTVDGKKIASNKLTIKVGPASSQQGGGGQARQPSTQDQSGSLSAKDLYLRAIPDKRTAVVGEQIIITYRIYTRVPVSSLSVTKLSSFPGFWTKNLLDNNASLQQTTQIIDGQEYVLADVRKVALFPQKTGKLTIEPMELECVAQIRTQQNQQRTRDPFESFFNDPFFNRNIQNVPKTLISEAITIDVEPVPVARRPQQFNGAVGQFGFQSAIDRNEIKANEAINISFTITGSGNLELIDLPRPIFPADFEVYDPKIVSDIKTSSNGISGSRKAEYLVIPRFQGSYRIEPVEFVYYDPRKKEYVTLRSQTFDIKVEKGSADSSGDVVYSSAQEGIRYLGSDIRHIKLKGKKLKPAGSYFFASPLYFLLVLGSLALFIGALLWTRKQEHLRQNQSLLRNRKATKVARKRLVNAEKHLRRKEQNEFYAEISQALWGYISDKFTIPKSELSFETVEIALKEKNAAVELVEQFILTLNNCEYARFAPGDVNKKMDDLYQQGIEVITKAERLIK
ncbi:MAG: BatD family protein [Bacteroidales bacterium]|jgi:hypothetical protein|nr:BatD family protein [Bacteroidales bacterium]